MTVSSSRPAAAAVAAPPRLGLLRTGLVIGAVFGVLGLGPLLDMGFDGSGWDIVLVVFAALAVVVAIGSIACLVLGWHGRRGPALWMIALQVVAVVPSLPAFFLPVEETTAEGPGPMLAVIGLVLTAIVIVVILLGLRRARGSVAA